MKQGQAVHQPVVVRPLPGSRQSELHYLADRFVAAARLLALDRREVRFVVPLASAETETLWSAAVARGAPQELPLQIVPRDAHAALAACDVALVASGTATLETALFKTPMVIVYKQSPISTMLMRRMGHVPYIGLPNILAGERLVPEFIQDKATPGALANALLELQQDVGAQRRQIAKFHEIHAVLRQNTAQKAADAVLAVIDAGGR